MTCPPWILAMSRGRSGHPLDRQHQHLFRDGRVTFRSFSRSQRIRNLRRDPRVTVLVEEGERYAELRGVMVQGSATLLDDPELIRELYAELTVKYEGYRLDPAALEARYGRYLAKNTAVVVEPERIISWDHTKLGGAY